jgi:hypothetical protein
LAPRKRLIVTLSFFGLITLSYVYAVLSTYRLHELSVLGFTLVGALVAFSMGYLSVVFLGGKASLRLVEFVSRLNGSTHAIEVKEEPEARTSPLIKNAPMLYISALVFVMSLALAWSIHNLHTTTDVTMAPVTSILHNFLQALDVFMKPPSLGYFSFSLEVMPLMILLVALAGLVPSIVLPFFRKFKVTSVNSAPFHRDLLFSTVGIFLGLGAVLSIVEVLYAMLVHGEPRIYSYVLPTILGLSLHYSLGSYVGIEKAEGMIEKGLRTEPGQRVFQGTVTVRGLPSDR